MRRSGREARTYPSFGFRQSSQRSQKSLVLSMKLASARTLRARRSGTGPGRWVDLASSPESLAPRRMYALGRAGRSRSCHFTAKRLPKTKLALHNGVNVDKKPFCCDTCRRHSQGSSAETQIVRIQPIHKQRVLGTCVRPGVAEPDCEPVEG